jgi:hypothetical protein
MNGTANVWFPWVDRSELSTGDFLPDISTGAPTVAQRCFSTDNFHAGTFKIKE